jgi:GDP-L-fucose synthase
MDKKAKIYVAGHTGLVGSAITKRLREKGYQNLTLKTISRLDLRRQQEVEKFFAKERPAYVFLAAAKVGGILANSTYQAEFIYDNLMIAANIIQAAYKYKVKKVLNLGSSCIYPRFAPQPLKEKYLLSGALESTNEPYAVAKIAAIKLCRYYNEQYGTNFISAMPTNLYGPNDNFNLETAHVIPALMRKFHLAGLLERGRYDLIKKDIEKYPLGFRLRHKLNLNEPRSITAALKGIGITKRQIKLWGSGRPYREFLYVDDLTDASVFLMERYDYHDIGELINIGTGRELKIRDLTALIREVVGFTGDILWDRSKPDGTPRKLLEVSRIKGLGWKSKVGIEEGIEKVYNWYLRQL